MLQFTLLSLQPSRASVSKLFHLFLNFIFETLYRPRDYMKNATKAFIEVHSHGTKSPEAFAPSQCATL